MCAEKLLAYGAQHLPQGLNTIEAMEAPMKLVLDCPICRYTICAL